MPGQVVVGRVVKAHGIRGEVAVDVLTDRPGRFTPGVRLYATRSPPDHTSGCDHGTSEPDRGSSGSAQGPSGQADRGYTVVSVRRHQDRLLVGFDEVGDRSAADRLRGAVLTAAVTDQPSSDTYSVAELTGMSVATADGRDVGTVAAVRELPAPADYDLLEVQRSDGTTLLLPATEEYVVAEGHPDGDRLVVVSPPPGLVGGEALTAGGQEDDHGDG